MRWALSEPYITKTKEHKQTKTALKTCGYLDWVYIKSNKGSRNKACNFVFLMWQGGQTYLEEFSWSIISQFTATLTQKLDHLKDKIPRHKVSKSVYAVQWSEIFTLERQNNFSTNAWLVDKKPAPPAKTQQPSCIKTRREAPLRMIMCMWCVGPLSNTCTLG